MGDFELMKVFHSATEKERGEVFILWLHDTLILAPMGYNPFIPTRSAGVLGLRPSNTFKVIRQQASPSGDAQSAFPFLSMLSKLYYIAGGHGMRHEVVFTNDPGRESMELWALATLLAHEVELPADVDAVTESGRYRLTYAPQFAPLTPPDV
ncbi:hypothetical protein ACTHPH_24105 [Paenibacillus pasadenensis]